MKPVCIHIIFFLFFISLASAQETEWRINPKVFNDTIKGHIYPRSNQLSLHSINDQLFHSDGFFWASTKGIGLQKQSVESKTIYFKGTPVHSQFPFAVSHNMEVRNDELYIGTARGFCKYDTARDSFILYGQNDLAKLSAYKSSVHAMEWISEDTVLIGNKWGLLLFDIKSDKIIKTLWDENPNVDGESSYNHVQQIIKDPLDKNLFWTVGREGLFSIDKRNWERGYVKYHDNIPEASPQNYMTDLIKKGDDIYILYCGQQTRSSYNGNQILKYNTNTKKWKQVVSQSYFRKVDGKMVHPIIHSFQEYGDYILICSRGFGPQIIDSRSDKVYQIYISHPFFKEKSVWKDDDRQLDFYLTDVFTGSIDRNGYLWTIQTRDHLVRSKEPILIKNKDIDLGSLQVHDIYVNGTKYVPFKYTNSEDKFSFTLNQRERDFAFKFSLVNCSVDSMIYEFKLNDQEWKEPINDYLVELNQLSGGKHVVKIRARKGEVIHDQKNVSINAQRRLNEEPWFIGSIIGFLGLIGFLFYRTKLKSIRNEEELKSAFQKQISEIEMQALRAQMNPHFLFNSLNSIKHYAVNKTKKETAQYITTFSQLVRQILQNSNDKIISLTQELQAVRLYLEVEQNRFDNKFTFALEVDNDLNTDTIFIPPLLIQPYVENAIWHGVMHKKEKGEIIVKIRQNQETLYCTIVDNGIGRTASAEVKKNKEKFKKKSLGTKITMDRIKLIEQIYGVTATVKIIDLYDSSNAALGTSVVIKIPKINQDIIHSLRNNPPV